MDIIKEVEISCETATSTKEDVMRCLSVLFGTRIGEQALNRDFGLNWDMLDMPIEAAKALLENEIVTKTRKYEPRAEVVQIIWNGDAASGNIKPKVVVNVVED